MKKKLYRWLVSIVCVFLVCENVYAQQHQITGVVKDPSGTTMPGVNVMVKGTAVGTTTDTNGEFSIMAGGDDVLTFSFIGYKSQDIRIGDQTRIEMLLHEDVETLHEVVVIGYGETKRRDVTGAISSITGDDLRKRSATTFDQALQGKVPGVVVQQISGQPGGGVSVQIRGISSLMSNTTPMYVIDGVIIGGLANAGSGTNPLAGINPSEIESVDVLKDASATAIYGSQASNGVIVITTKRGKAGAPQITYDFYTGFQQIAQKVDVMNLKEFATFLNARNAAPGWGFDERPEFANPQYLGKGTDWQDELFRNAPMTDHSINVSGGDDRTQYMFSGSYFKQQGIALGSDFKRISVRLNLDNKTTNWLKTGVSLQLVNIKEKVATSGSNVINTALSQTPDIPVTNSDGSWGGAYNENGWVNSTVNPVAIAKINKDEVKRNQLFGNVYAEITFMDGLTLRNELTGSFSTAVQDQFSPTYEMGLVKQNTNSSSYSYGENSNTTIRNYATYARTFLTQHNLNVMVGHEAQLGKSESVGASRSNFPSNNVQVISNGDPTTATNSGRKDHNAVESYFGRVNLSFYDKYLLTFNGRTDGSSKFAEGNRWVTTYSGAFAWKLTNEGFMQNIRQVNEMKLRVGYGLTNNQGIPDYRYTSLLETVPTGLSGTSQLTKNVANPYVEWEKTQYANIGLDATLFNWRLNFSVDFYNRRTDDLLLQIPLPLYSGTAVGWSPGSLEAPYVNVGTINNQGFDFRISSTNVKGKFTWTTDLTVSRNINEVKELNTGGASLDKTYSKTVEGRSIGEFYGYQVDGIFATAGDFETHARPVKNGVPLAVGQAGGSIWYGDLMFKDQNGDGIIDESDQTFLGSPIPKYQIGLSNTFSYKNFDLNIFFNANYGNKVFNQMRVNGENPGTSFGYFSDLKGYAKLALIDPTGSSTDVNNVYVTNPDTRIVSLRNDNTNGNNRNSDKFIEDGSFIRCRTISVGYTFPKELLQRVHVGSLKVRATVSNVFLVSKYKGMDPEIGSWDPLSAGIDGGFYPQPRVFTIGATLQLR